MDSDRTMFDDRSLDLRARSSRTQRSLERPLDVTSAPERPVHGGPTAPERAAHQPERQDLAREHYDRSMAVLSEMLHLPGDSEIDIQVDVKSNQVTFQIRDRDTGRLLLEVPENDAKPLMEKLREFGGTLVDRSL